MTVMGLDYGSKTVGVALSDGLLLTAHPVETIWRKKEKSLRKTIARIIELINENEVSKIILGLPLMLDDSVGERAQKTLEFKKLLEEKTGLEVIMVDERFTTDASAEELDVMGIKKSEQKTYIDQLAACLILEEYLKKQENGRK